MLWECRKTCLYKCFINYLWKLNHVLSQVCVRNKYFLTSHISGISPLWPVGYLYFGDLFGKQIFRTYCLCTCTGRALQSLTRDCHWHLNDCVFARLIIKHFEMLQVDIYRENILGPREEMLKAKQEAEFYKFNSTWRGRGQRLGVRHLSLWFIFCGH